METKAEPKKWNRREVISMVLMLGSLVLAMIIPEYVNIPKTPMFLLSAGVFAIVCAYFDWNWFMMNRKARLITEMFGDRNNARIFYSVLGAMLLLIGVFSMLAILGGKSGS